MAFLAKAKKEDLRVLAEELGETVGLDLKVIEIKDLILKSNGYEEEFVKALLSSIIEDRKAKEESEQLALAQALAQANLEKERAFELEKLRLNLETQKNAMQEASVGSSEDIMHKWELQKLIPTFNQKDDDMGLYLNLFERQMKFFKIPERKWVAYLIGILPTEVAKLIAREPEEKSQDFSHIKDMLLKRFKLTAEKFRQLFSQHRKASESTWRDFSLNFERISKGGFQSLT